MSGEPAKKYEVHFNASEHLDLAAAKFRRTLGELAAFFAVTAPDRPTEHEGAQLQPDIVYEWDIDRAAEYLFRLIDSERPLPLDLPDPEGRESRVFVSYRCEDDDEFVAALVEYFDQRAVKYFKAPESIPPGSEWRDRLRDELCKCDRMLAVVSPNYKSGEWCLVECGAAWIGQRTGMRVVPVVRHGTPQEAVPEVYQTFQAVHEGEGEDRNALFTRIVSVLTSAS